MLYQRVSSLLPITVRYPRLTRHFSQRFPRCAKKPGFLFGQTEIIPNLTSRTGAGYDNIDVAACTARSIAVSNCPEVVDDATSDCAAFLILAALRGFNNGILAIRNREWNGAVPPGPLGRDPQGKTLGILGLGGIGVSIKKKMEVFGMKVIYHNRTPSKISDGADYVSFDELLARSDVLSLNLPLNVSPCPHPC